MMTRLSTLEQRLARWMTALRRLPPWLAAALVMFGAAFLVFGRVLLRPGLMVSGSDFVQFYFWEAFTRSELAAGRLPLWNPYFFSGYPAAANPQMLLFYPPAMLLRLLPLSYAFGAGIWLHMGWAGLGMCLLARRMGQGAAAALTAGLVFMMSGVYVAHIQGGHLEWLYTLAWLAWVIAAWARLFESGGWRNAGLAGLLSALMTLGGALRVLACAGVMILILAAFWLWPVVRRRDWRRLTRAGGGGALAAALAIGLAAPQLLPALELAARSSRAAGLALACMTQFSLTLGDLASLGLPRFPQPPFLEWERTAYIGAVGLGLGLIGIFNNRAGRWRGLLLAWAAAGLLLGVGPALPVYAAARLLFPVLALVRQPFTFIVLIAFAGAGLAGVGVEALLAAGRPRAWPVALMLGPLAAGLLADLAVYQAQPAPADSTLYGRLAWLAGFSAPRALAGLLAVLALSRLPFKRMASALALAVILADLWLFCYARISILPAASPAQQAAYVPRLDPAAERVLTEPYMASDQSMAVGVANAQGYAPIVVAAYDDFVAGLGARDACPSFEHANLDTGDTTLLQRLSVAQVIKAGGGGRAIPDPGPRAWWASSAITTADNQAAIRLSRSAGFDFYNKVVLEGGAGGAGEDAGAGVVRITQYSAQQVIMRVDSTAPGWVVLNDVWYPGWEASVNGAAAPVLRADGAFRAVALPAGHSIVVLRFHSVYLAAGLLLAAVSLAGLLACLVLGWFRPPAIR